ncbi:MAG TPA: hypothetical protein VFZ53_18380 [Polyangiaceae bacterium]
MGTRVLVFLVLVALDACGGKAARRGRGEGDGRTGGAPGASGAATSGGGAGSSAASSSGGRAGRGGSNGMTGGEAGSRGGEGNDSGAGGETGPGGAGGESGVRFLLLEPPPPLTFPPGATETSEREDALSVTGASRDGSVLAGVFSYRYPSFNVPEDGEAFIWSEAEGVVRLGADALPGRRPLAVDYVWLSADGARLFGKYEERHESGNGRDFGGFFSWSRGDGVRRAFALEDIAEAVIDFVADDARTAVGTYRFSNDITTAQSLRTYRFTEAGGAVDLGVAEGLPETVVVTRMSPDGHALLVNSNDAAPPRAFRYTETDGAQALGALDGFPECWAELMSDDAAVIVGSCSNGATSRGFRWTEAGGMVALEGVGADDQVRALSADGSVVLGTTVDATGLSALFRWTEADGKTVVASPAETNVFLDFYSLTDDGRVAFGSLVPRENGDLGEPGTQAFRWSDAGIQPLGFLEGDDVSEVFTAAADGSVLGGTSHAAHVLGRAALWDRRGIRDVTAELDQAGVDRHGSEPSFVHRVWSSSTTLVVQGTDTAGRSWVAWLPARE